MALTAEILRGESSVTMVTMVTRYMVTMVTRYMVTMVTRYMVTML